MVNVNFLKYVSSNNHHEAMMKVSVTLKIFFYGKGEFMDNFTKRITKRTVVYITFFYAMFIVVFDSIFRNLIFGNMTNSEITDFARSNSYEFMSKAQESLWVFKLEFYVMLIGSIILVLFLGYYFFKKNKNRYILINLIVCGVAVVLMIMAFQGFNVTIKYINMIANGDAANISPYAVFNDIGSMQNTSRYINYVYYLNLFLLVFNCILIVVAKKENNILKFSFDESIGVQTKSIEQNDENSSEQPMENVSTDKEKNLDVQDNSIDKIKTFIKSKNGKIYIGVLCAVIVLLGGYKIWDIYFNKTVVNIMPKVSVEYGGESGSGYIRHVDPGTIDYDHSNDDIRSFLDSITYDYDSLQDLKNGDKIKIYAIYSKERAKELKLDIKNTSVTVKVKGLSQRYQKAKEIPEKIKKRIKSDFEKKMKSRYVNRSYAQYQYTFNHFYFGVKGNRCYVVGVYKIDETSTIRNETESYYSICYIDNVDSDYLKESNHYVYVRQLYDTGSYEKLKDESKIETALSESFEDGYKFTKFE